MAIVDASGSYSVQVIVKRNWEPMPENMIHTHRDLLLNLSKQADEKPGKWIETREPVKVGPYKGVKIFKNKWALAITREIH